MLLYSNFVISHLLNQEPDTDNCNTQRLLCNSLTLLNSDKTTTTQRRVHFRSFYCNRYSIKVIKDNQTARIDPTLGTLLLEGMLIRLITISEIVLQI